MKKIFAILLLSIISTSIAGIFWYNDYVYSSPTPIPAGYIKIRSGAPIALKQQLQFNNGKPLFLHFFNPDCPCSRFNVAHFKSLITKYGQQTNFLVVMMTNKNYTPATIQQKFGLRVPIIIDPALAVACGVYSTPQAVILTADSRLYYRGNYNNSRYCTDARTAYAQLALKNLLANDSPGHFNRLALTAYGCRLPNCNK